MYFRCTKEVIMTPQSLNPSLKSTLRKGHVRSPRCQAGFTLIELLVVLSIIYVLIR